MEAKTDEVKCVIPGVDENGVSAQTKEARLREQIRASAEAIPADKLRAPTMSIAVHLAEGYAIVRNARDHSQALVAVGMGPGLPDNLEEHLEELRNVHATLQRQKRGRSQETVSLMAKAQQLRRDGIDACDLAMYGMPDRLRQLADVRATEPSPPEVPMLLIQLAMLLRDNANILDTVNFDAKLAATEMKAVAARLQLALAADEAVGPVVKLQDYRDRLFTLTSMQIGRIRSYATYAFRNDATERRRKAFASDFVRAKNRAAKRRNKQKEGAADHDEPGSPAVPAEPFLKVG